MKKKLLIDFKITNTQITAYPLMYLICSYSMYAVIEFDPEQGGGLSAVGSIWLTPKKNALFASFKEQALFVKFVKRRKEINEQTWKLYQVTFF